jgi:hypothetical protein
MSSRSRPTSSPASHKSSMKISLVHLLLANVSDGETTTHRCWNIELCSSSIAQMQAGRKTANRCIAPCASKATLMMWKYLDFSARRRSMPTPSEFTFYFMARRKRDDSVAYKWNLLFFSRQGLSSDAVRLHALRRLTTRSSLFTLNDLFEALQHATQSFLSQ